jgi:putative oxidoreductase
MSKYENHLYSILRIVAGFLFLWHGSEKLFGFPQPAMGIPAFIAYFGGTIEFAGGILVMIGLFTRWAAFISSGEMAFAYWMVHGTMAALPIVNHGELAMLFCFLFLFIAAKGPGGFSIDYYRSGKKRNDFKMN